MSTYSAPEARRYSRPIEGSINLDAARRLALSARQAELLFAIARGWSGYGVADRDATARGSINGRVQTVVRKLGAVNRAHAVAIAYDLGLFAPRDAPAGHADTPAVLSVADQALMQCIADGDTYAETGRRFGLSELAVKDRCKRIRARFGARNVTHLVSLLHRHNLVH